MCGKGICTGCWRLPVLSVLILHFIPLFAHGNLIGENVTDPGSPLNVTSLPNENDDAKMVEVLGVTEPDSLSAAHKPKVGEDGGSGMLGEDLHPVTVRPTEKARGQEISPDSAETDHLLPHELANTQQETTEVDEEELKQTVHTDPPWLNNKDDQESQETTVFDLDRQDTPITTPSSAVRPSSPDVLTVDFFDPGSRRRDLEPPSPSAHELQGRDPTSYDYFTPYYDSVFPTPDEYLYSTTTDMYDDELTTTPPSKPPKPPKAAKPAKPIKPRIQSSFNLDDMLPSGAAEDEDPPAPPGVVDSSNGSQCRQGYERSNGTCRSICDRVPNYCFNGGQCYLLEGTGVFCRCNVQDYVWNKGSRCEAVITEFQVMCIAIGASAVMLLLLFMIIVCFAKKLHVLKTENNKLRKRSSKYRPSSEQHNDNFSLSTIAEGSHPNDDPNAQNKLEDPVKAPPSKEDESLNIQNSLTPKHENHKGLGEENSSETRGLCSHGMTIDVELHLPQNAKIPPPSSPHAHYDVYLYKVAKSSRNGRTRDRVRWEDCSYTPLSPCPAYSPVSTRSLPAVMPRRSRRHTLKTCTP
uniref:Neural chondroitin sulphate proteoglycan cytoplasmic domain-containing protein n=1 Tax=Denticeps clupeoides TaxID=299321 RepID=A0AAY4A3F2_9TELE